jgi:hypothetical protein
MRVLLTDRFVAGRKPPERGQQEFFDTKVAGLSLRLSQGGAKAWSLLYSRGRRRVRIRLGTYPAMELGAARSAALDAKASVEAGGDPRAVSGGTLAALVETYLARHVRPNLRSAQMVEQRFRRAVIPLIGDVPLAAIHRRDINRAIDALMAKGTPIEANRTFSELRGCFRWALRRGDIDRDPTAAMALPAPARSRERTLNDDEIMALWAALPTAFASVETQRILRLCLITGQRVGEISGMVRAEIDRGAREWHIPGSRTKNGCSHTVHLSAWRSRKSMPPLPRRTVPEFFRSRRATWRRRFCKRGRNSGLRIGPHMILGALSPPRWPSSGSSPLSYRTC